MLGCFAMTELGCGSNIPGLETQARFDPTTDEFVLNSPTITSTKVVTRTNIATRLITIQRQRQNRVSLLLPHLLFCFLFMSCGSGGSVWRLRPRPIASCMHGCSSANAITVFVSTRLLVIANAINS